MFKPSFDSGPVSRNSRPDLPPTATSLSSLGGILSNSVALPEPRLAGFFSPRELPPLCVSPRPDKQESLFLRELGPVGFYYSLVYRLFDLGEWVCFSLLVVSTVSWGCFSFRLGFRGGYWFVAFRPVVSSPCSFYP